MARRQNRSRAQSLRSGVSRRGQGPRSGNTIRTIDSGMDTKRVNGPTDPVSTSQDCVFTKKVTYQLGVPVGSTGATLNAALVITGIPTVVGLTYRILKVSVYAPATDLAHIAISDLKSDEADFVDFGTQGSLRPQIHLRPAWQLRNQWWDYASAESFYQIFAAGTVTTTQVVIQLTLEVRLPIAVPITFRTPGSLPTLRRGTVECGALDEPIKFRPSRPALESVSVTDESDTD